MVRRILFVSTLVLMAAVLHWQSRAINNTLEQFIFGAGEGLWTPLAIQVWLPAQFGSDKIGYHIGRRPRLWHLRLSETHDTVEENAALVRSRWQLFPYYTYSDSEASDSEVQRLAFWITAAKRHAPHLFLADEEVEGILDAVVEWASTTKRYRYEGLYSLLSPDSKLTWLRADSFNPASPKDAQYLAERHLKTFRLDGDFDWSEGYFLFELRKRRPQHFLSGIEAANFDRDFADKLAAELQKTHEVGSLAVLGQLLGDRAGFRKLPLSLFSNINLEQVEERFNYSQRVALQPWRNLDTRDSQELSGAQLRQIYLLAKFHPELFVSPAKELERFREECFRDCVCSGLEPVIAMQDWARSEATLTLEWNPKTVDEAVKLLIAHLERFPRVELRAFADRGSALCAIEGRNYRRAARILMEMRRLLPHYFSGGHVSRAATKQVRNEREAKNA